MVSGGVALVQGPWLRVAEVLVEGNATVPAVVVQDQVDALGRGILFVDEAAMAQRVAALPRVESATVARVLPRQVRVTVVERQPWAVWSQAGKSYLVDLEAYVLAAVLPAGQAETASLWQIKGLDTTSLAEWPTAALAERWDELERIWKDLVDRERTLRLAPPRRPDPGFGVPAFEWASGVDFDDLSTRGMAPGDFVRVSRQLVDLVRQLRDTAPGLRQEAMAVLRAIDRGVVAAQGVG